MKNKNTSAYSSLVNVYSCLCVFYLSIFFFLVKEMENVFCIFFKRKVICFVLKTWQVNGWYSVELTVLIVNWLRLFSDMKINNEDKVYLMYCCFFLVGVYCFQYFLCLSFITQTFDSRNRFYYLLKTKAEEIIVFTNVTLTSQSGKCFKKCEICWTKL